MITTREREEYLAKKREVRAKSENFTNIQYYMAMVQISKEYKDSLRMALLESNAINSDTKVFQLKVDYLKAKQEYNKYKILELEQENVELEEIYKKEWADLSSKN